MANSTSGLCLAPVITAFRDGAVAAGNPKAISFIAKIAAHSIAGGYSGSYRIAGSTVDGGTPVKRAVYLFAHPGLVLVRSTVTELPAATYEFTGLAAGSYLVVGVDPDGVQNAVSYSHVSAVA